MIALHLVSFADGGEGYSKGAERLTRTAADSGFFSSINIYNYNRLKSENPEWANQHEKFIHTNRRGFGYWVWKPRVISLQLGRLKPNDTLLYLDAGCQINGLGIKRLALYVNEAVRAGMLCFYLNGPNYRIGQWTKGDLLRYFGVSVRDPLLELPQVESGIIFLSPTIFNLSMLDQWERTCLESNYSLVNDNLSLTTNNEDFIEHRHDMAIFTLMHYRSSWGKSIRNENYFPASWQRGLHPKIFPICASRGINESRVSIDKLTVK